MELGIDHVEYLTASDASPKQTCLRLATKFTYQLVPATHGDCQMFARLKLAALASVLFLLAGCAGKDFNRPRDEALLLGKTSYAGVIRQMGQPYRTGEVLKNEQKVKTTAYAYAATGGEPLEEGVIPARALGYYFHDETLVGKEFLSSFKSDNSNFDDSKISSIIKGKTTRAEVVRLLGRPTAAYIYPMVKKTSGEAIGYGYQTTRGGVFGGFKFFSKSLIISFDDNGIVSDVEFTSSGNR